MNDHYSKSMSPAAAALLTLAGVGLLWWGVASFVHWRHDVAAERAAQAQQMLERESRAREAQAEREAAARAEQRQAALRKQEITRTRTIAARQQADDDTRQAIAAAAERKEKAWAAYYRKPSNCNDAATLDCANAYIRSRRAFEERYARSSP